MADCSPPDKSRVSLCVDRTTLGRVATGDGRVVALLSATPFKLVMDFISLKMGDGQVEDVLEPVGETVRWLDWLTEGAVDEEDAEEVTQLRRGESIDPEVPIRSRGSRCRTGEKTPPLLLLQPLFELWLVAELTVVKLLLTEFRRPWFSFS